MRGYHVYEDISELPCLPEQMFAKIIMPRDQNIPKGTGRFGRLQGSVLLLFQSSERPACTALLAALLEAEAVFRIPGLLDLATA